jgi:hypothetical protein
LVLGVNTVIVTARDSAGNVNSTTLTVVYTVAATLLSPTGSVTTNVPVFSWTASPVVTAYILRVDDATQSGKILRTLTPTDAGCATGGTCQFAPGVTLASGFATWTVQTLVGSGGVTSTPVTFAVPNDTTPPVVVVTSPVSKSVISTGAATIALGGSAQDTTSVIASVTWQTSTGASGTASGTTTWTANVPLVDGENVITITARDSFGNAGTDTLTVHRQHAKN